jgi:hypothetical protein
MSNTKPLSIAQLLILSTAAQRADHMVLPLPAGLRARGASQKTLLTSLVRLGLIEEQPTGDAALSWRCDGCGQHHALCLTQAGLVTIMGELEPQADIAAAVAVTQELLLPETSLSSVDISDATSAPRTGRPSGKLGQVLDAIGTAEGATLGELVTLTGWQAHTTRAALTRLRQRGFGVFLNVNSDRKAYRATPGAQS